jgi:phosphoglycolate phosphatase-like HAD superfamily hydrolase
VIQGKTIALDVDNTLADTVGVFCKLATVEFGYPIERRMIGSPKIAGSIRADPRVIFSILDKIWNDWPRLPPLELDVGSTVEQLRSRENRVIIATSRPERSIEQVKSWLMNNNVSYDEFRHFNPERRNLR